MPQVPLRGATHVLPAQPPWRQVAGQAGHLNPIFLLAIFFASFGKQVIPLPFFVGNFFLATFGKPVISSYFFWQLNYQNIRWSWPMTLRIVLGAIWMQRLSWFASWGWRWTRATSSGPWTHISRTRDFHVLLGIFLDVEIKVMFDLLVSYLLSFFAYECSGGSSLFPAIVYWESFIAYAPQMQCKFYL